jgi:hypothetical protein
VDDLIEPLILLLSFYELINIIFEFLLFSNFFDHVVFSADTGLLAFTNNHGAIITRRRHGGPVEMGYRSPQEMVAAVKLAGASGLPNRAPFF